MLDYLMWNSTTHPSGPPDVYSEQTMWDNYSGGDHINASELAYGVNNEIDDHGHAWIYGYFMAPNGYDDASVALRRICTWVDFPVDFYNYARQVPVPKEGHPNHVPVAIPLNGTYDHWVSVRGIHTDHDAWNYTGPLSVYGFWLNDPHMSGLGSNTYVTLEKLASEYYDVLDVPGDYYNNKFVVVTDPPQLEGVETPAVTATEIIFAQHPAGFTNIESLYVQRALGNIKTRIFTDRFVIDAAYNDAWDVLKYSRFADVFQDAVVHGKPMYLKNECRVSFINGLTEFVVLIGRHQGELQQIQILTMSNDTTVS